MELFLSIIGTSMFFLIVGLVLLLVNKWQTYKLTKLIESETGLVVKRLNDLEREIMALKTGCCSKED